MNEKQLLQDVKESLRKSIQENPDSIFDKRDFNDCFDADDDFNQEVLQVGLELLKTEDDH